MKTTQLNVKYVKCPNHNHRSIPCIQKKKQTLRTGDETSRSKKSNSYIDFHTCTSHFFLTVLAKRSGPSSHFSWDFTRQRHLAANAAPPSGEFVDMI